MDRLKYLKHIFLLAMLLVTATACERRDLANLEETQQKVWTANILVNVNGFELVKTLNATISGFAANWESGLVTMPYKLDNWTAQTDDSAYSTTFYCYGLPFTHTGTPEDNELTLVFTLKDGTTLEQKVNVGDKFVVDNKNRILSLTISVTIEKPEDDPLAGGYDIIVEPWEEEK